MLNGLEIPIYLNKNIKNMLFDLIYIFLTYPFKKFSKWYKKKTSNFWLNWHWWRTKGCYHFKCCMRCVKPGTFSWLEYKNGDYYLIKSPLCKQCDDEIKISTTK